jgi:hypothetical protein
MNTFLFEQYAFGDLSHNYRSKHFTSRVPQKTPKKLQKSLISFRLIIVNLFLTYDELRMNEE